METTEPPVGPKPPKGPHWLLPVYTNRWKHRDNYYIWHTETGWYIDHMAHYGPTDYFGQPVLDWNFKQDHVDYVSGLSPAMQSIWNDVKSGKFTHEQIQEKFERIGDLIEESEREPRSKSGYKKKRR